MVKDMADTIIKLENIYKKYKTTLDWVLKDISLEINEAELIFICGPSGVGKSTLLHLVGLMDKPNEGRVLFLQKEIDFKKDNLSKIRLEHIGFVFQFHYLLEHLTVKENIMLPYWVKNGGKVTSDSVDYIEEYLDFLGISNLVSRYPHELSGGEQQRVALARALVNRPKIIIADEPTGNLDQENAKNIVSLIKNFVKNYGSTCIIATHNIELTKFGDRVLHMRDGKIIN
ncbi:MAG: ABC transporter ATP-binding protein [Endomicrobia bacterium]|nr:ABC transporter ATP-binding protein [Endomicrobiia bacterium]MCX7940786.1 ABC transporter ATP-binding protein [Endomicrobiia bacterium]MDW8055614.1 ABC transporter ATP-binding protein [Elusimicrobiota bacterium]